MGEFDVSLINTPFHSSKEWEDVTWIPELTAYAREKNILVYGWDEIKVLDNKAGRDFVFDRYKEMGLDGIKIDYIDSDRFIQIFFLSFLYRSLYFLIMSNYSVPS